MRNSVVYIIICLLYGCNIKHDQYYEKTSDEWKGYLQEIGADYVDLHNTILLVLASSECNPSIDEIKWWDEYNRTNQDYNIILIIIERYHRSFQIFLDFEEITIPAYRDSTGIVLKFDLLPITPMKVLFDKDENIKKIADIGLSADPSQKAFIVF